MHKNFILLTSILLFCCPSLSLAKQKLPVPRFVSIKSSEANMRTGPDVRYPIKWVFIKKNEPVEIVAEFEHWRKIKDKSGEEGWMHESVLSGKRYAVIQSDKVKLVRTKDVVMADGVFWVSPEVRVALLACNKEWCKIQSQGMKGWLERKYIWGIYPNETFK
jgi:SH3-like domain-containing protein